MAAVASALASLFLIIAAVVGTPRYQPYDRPQVISDVDDAIAVAAVPADVADPLVGIGASAGISLGTDATLNVLMTELTNNVPWAQQNFGSW